MDLLQEGDGLGTKRRGSPVKIKLPPSPQPQRPKGPENQASVGDEPRRASLPDVKDLRQKDLMTPLIDKVQLIQ